MTPADQSSGAVPDRSSPCQALPSRGSHIASTLTRIAGGNRPHAATTSTRSGGTALDFTLVLGSTPVFPR